MRIRIRSDAGGAHEDEDRFVRIAEIMTSPVVAVSEQTSLEEVARVMGEHGIGGVPVLDDQEGLVGIVTDSDFAGTERYVPFACPATKLPAVFGEWMQGEPFEALCERARRLPARAIMTASEEERSRRWSSGCCTPTSTGSPSFATELAGIIARHDLLKLMLGAPTATAVSAP